MDEFQVSITTIISALEESGYSQKTIAYYKNCYRKIEEILKEQNLVYSVGLGDDFLSENNGSIFQLREEKAAITKLNNFYRFGKVESKSLQPRCYSSVVLDKSLTSIINEYLIFAKEQFTQVSSSNNKSRIVTFLKQLQSNGKYTIECIEYDDVLIYHNSLMKCSKSNRMMKEASVYNFLRFVSDQGKISITIPLFLYCTSHDRMIFVNNLFAGGVIKSDCFSSSSGMSPVNALALLDQFLDSMRQHHYSDMYIKIGRQVILYASLVFGYNNLLINAQNIDVMCEIIRQQKVANLQFVYSFKRFLTIILNYSNETGFPITSTFPKRIKGLDELPIWCKEPVFAFLEERLREGVSNGTIRCYAYSVLRFCRFLVSREISSYEELTTDLISDFNLFDKHSSPLGKNTCNNRIQRFILYLERNNIVKNSSLHLSLLTASAKSEKLIDILTEDEINEVHNYVESAKSPLALRDSAMLMIGLEMGVRGIDIAKLQIRDVNLKNRTIRFVQSKTGVELCLPFPISVGNAIFRYLRNGRPRGVKSNSLFLKVDAPHSEVSKNTCHRALERALKSTSYGFHVLRRTFSTYKLRKGIKPQMISDALGHRNPATLKHYLSLDDERMSSCGLSLSDLQIGVDSNKIFI